MEKTYRLCMWRENNTKKYIVGIQGSSEWYVYMKKEDALRHYNELKRRKFEDEELEGKS